jgi:hypothetical protein
MEPWTLSRALGRRQRRRASQTAARRSVGVRYARSDCVSFPQSLSKKAASHESGMIVLGIIAPFVMANTEKLSTVRLLLTATPSLLMTSPHGNVMSGSASCNARRGRLRCAPANGPASVKHWSPTHARRACIAEATTVLRKEKCEVKAISAAIADLPQDAQDAVLQYAWEEAERRVQAAVNASVPRHVLIALEERFSAGDAAGAFGLLEATWPDYASTRAFELAALERALLDQLPGIVAIELSLASCREHYKEVFETLDALPG